ncbi:MAG: hypothetical protein WAX14_10240 [Rhodococcus sp. (in: high G+C Gram-positive bacteria)]|uniref:hypothetical protein n=1 Tax=Rhodococcus sp. TaxID=1831 RepID=UPI003BB64394
MGQSGATWRALARHVEQFDADAGRAVHAALRDHGRPPTVQIVGRAGGGHELALAEQAVGCTVEHIDLDVPGRADPVVDADVVILVSAVRFPPHAIHPVDRALLDRVDAGRVVVALAGTESLADPGSAVAAVAEQLRSPVLLSADTDALETVVGTRLHDARRRRDDALTRTIAGIAATPPARDAIEDALDDPGAWSGR